MRKQEQEQEQDHHKQDVNQKKPEEITKLERLQEENEYLRTEVAYLKKTEGTPFERSISAKKKTKNHYKEWTKTSSD
ncbi:TPA: transposase [Streptococcus pyogenes]